MPHTIVIRGPLGVGKSTVARELAKRLNGSYFSIDETLAELGLDTAEDEGIPISNFVRANEQILGALKDNASTGRASVIDGNFYHREQLDHLIVIFPDAKVFTLKAPVDVCIRRDRERPKSYGEDATRAMHAMVSRFDAGEIVDTEQIDAEETLKEIMKRL